jgi:threonine aldolase
MFCLSKGLGAPVGSMLVGSRDAMAEARIYRKALGGGMRQAGVLAAAGLIALETMPLRLGEDHANVRMLAEKLVPLPEVEIDLDLVQTNILVFKLRTRASSEVIARLKERGVLIGAVGPHTVRIVTHLDVSPADCRQAAKVLEEVLG